MKIIISAASFVLSSCVAHAALPINTPTAGALPEGVKMDVQHLNSCKLLVATFDTHKNDDQFASYRTVNLCDPTGTSDHILAVGAGSTGANDSNPPPPSGCGQGCALVSVFHNSFCSGPGTQKQVTTFIWEDNTGTDWTYTVVYTVHTPSCTAGGN